jgi:hypothetical protein
VDLALQKAETGALPRRAEPQASRPDSGGPRRIFVVIAGLTVAGVLVLLVIWGGRRAVAWLHRQAPYQLPFQDIRLEPGPPVWFRGGKRAFLDGVRRQSREPTPISVLNVGPERLAGAFKNYPWIEEVKVRYVPGGITVRPRYRWPVAYVQLDHAVQVVVDHTGTILPAEDLDETCSEVKSLLKITGEGLVPPSDPRPGVKWKTSDWANESRVLAAAKLAGFLREEPRFSEASKTPALHMIELIVSDFYRRGLFAVNAQGAVIWWRGAPDEEGPGEPSAASKWAILSRWAATTEHRSLAEGDYWAFGKTEIRLICTHPGMPHLGSATHGASGAKNSRPPQQHGRKTGESGINRDQDVLLALEGPFERGPCIR